MLATEAAAALTEAVAMVAEAVAVIAEAVAVASLLSTHQVLAAVAALLAFICLNISLGGWGPRLVKVSAVC